MALVLRQARRLPWAAAIRQFASNPYVRRHARAGIAGAYNYVRRAIGSGLHRRGGRRPMSVPHYRSMRRGAPSIARVPRGIAARPSVGVIDHKTKKAHFSIYQHYEMGETGAVEYVNMAVTMSASELLYVFRPAASVADPTTFRARIPAFYNVAAKWMGFVVTGMKMQISDETPMQVKYSGTDTMTWDHRGGAWSTVWNETESDSHKPMVQYVDNARTVVPRWDFQKEAKWEDKSYQRAAFLNWRGQSVEHRKGGKRKARWFFSRYSALRSPANVGEGANGVHVVNDRRDWLPTLHLHQPDQFLQYQANAINFHLLNGTRTLRLRVKKTIYVEFVDKREVRDISRTPMNFRPHADECWQVTTAVASVSQYCGGCTAGLDPAAQCSIAGGPNVGPIPDPAACSQVCGTSCEDMICPPGEVPLSIGEFGCVDACAPGTFQPGAPCFEIPPPPLTCEDARQVGAPCEADVLDSDDNCFGSTPGDSLWKLTRAPTSLPDVAYPCSVGEVLKPDTTFSAGCETDIIRASCQPI